MKHVVTDLNDPNEPIMFNHSILGNYSYDTFFGNHTTDISSYAESNTQYEILHCTQIVEPHCNIVYKTNTNPDVHPNIVSRDKLEVYTNFTNPNNLENKTKFESITKPKGDPNMWTLFFDGSKSLEGVGVGCILKDPNGKNNLIACRLEFQCTNNTVEYEALLQGLKREVDMKERKIKVFGDSEIVIRQVRNTIHFLSSHLKHYQQEVWELIKKFECF
jgi:hypothetical protein